MDPSPPSLLLLPRCACGTGMVVAERMTETGGDSCCCAPEPTKVTRTSILGSVHFLCHSHRPFSAQYSRGARRLTCHGGGLWAKAAGAEKCGRGVAGVWGCGARFGLRRLGLGCGRGMAGVRGVAEGWSSVLQLAACSLACRVAGLQGRRVAGSQGCSVTCSCTTGVCDGEKMGTPYVSADSSVGTGHQGSGRSSPPSSGGWRLSAWPGGSESRRGRQRRRLIGPAAASEAQAPPGMPSRRSRVCTAREGDRAGCCGSGLGRKLSRL